MFLGGHVQRHWGIRRTALLGGTLLAVTVGLSAWTVHSYVLFTFTFGACFGIANGLAMSCPLNAVYAVWPAKQHGVVSGIVLSGLGLSGLLVGPLQTLIVNPNNLTPSLAPFPTFPSEIYYDQPAVLLAVPRMFLVMGAVFFLITLLATAALPPWVPQQKRPSVDHVAQQFDGEPTWTLSGPQLSASQMVGERQFWLVWVVFLLTGNFVNFIALFWKLIGQTEARLSDRTVTSVGNLVAAISNTAGRLVWGALADLHGVQRVMVWMGFTAAILLATLARAVACGPVFFFVWIGLLYLCVGGSFVVLPMVTALSFGRVHFATNYSVVYTARVLSTFLSSSMFACIQGSFGIQGVCAVVAVGMAIGSIASFFLDASAVPRRYTSKMCDPRQLLAGNAEYTPFSKRKS
eukprot:GHVT01011139.1.p1 GENE.GHVT01011139.1~~GHVT01011139.1.p1  ORF type:complete len:405 (-),score=32.34 GHVT01011139.1:89-1303(-)